MPGKQLSIEAVWAIAGRASGPTNVPMFFEGHEVMSELDKRAIFGIRRLV